MLYVRRSRFIRFVILPLTLVTFLPACHKWVPLEGPVRPALAGQHPNPVRLTLLDNGERIELSSWRVEADSVFGATTRRGSGIGIPIGQVQAVEGQRTDAGKTVLATVGTVAAGFALVLAVAAISCCEIDLSGTDWGIFGQPR